MILTPIQALQHLRPAHFMLAGDSAGGNLALACAALLLEQRYSLPESRFLSVHSTHVLQAKGLLQLTDVSACFHTTASLIRSEPPTAAADMGAALASTKSPASSKLLAVLLIYPFLDPSCSGASHTVHAASPALSSAEIAWFWNQYAAGSDIAHNSASPLFAPLNITDDVLRRMPSCFVCTAGQDPLCDDGLSLVTRLKVTFCL